MNWFAIGAGMRTVGMLMGEGRTQLNPEHACSLRKWLDELLPVLMSRAPARPARSALTYSRGKQAHLHTWGNSHVPTSRGAETILSCGQGLQTDTPTHTHGMATAHLLSLSLFSS